MTKTPLMPKATAIWLFDKTSLSFEQIAEFCQLHVLEVAAIADGDTAKGIQGLNPITTGQLSREEIEKGQKDPEYRLRHSEQEIPLPAKGPKQKGRRYTPISRRQDRPNAILWLQRHHPELRSSQISRLVGTTKNTIDAVKNRKHWNSANLTPLDPVTLGLCNQTELDQELQKAAKYVKETPQDGAEKPETLLPVEETTSEDAMVAALGVPKPKPRIEEKIDADTVFAKLGKLKKRVEKE